LGRRATGASVGSQTPPGWYPKDGRPQWWNGSEFVDPPEGSDSAPSSRRKSRRWLLTGVAFAVVVAGAATAAITLTDRQPGGTKASSTRPSQCSGPAYEDFLGYTGAQDTAELCTDYLRTRGAPDESDANLDAGYEETDSDVADAIREQTAEIRRQETKRHQDRMLREVQERAEQNPGPDYGYSGDTSGCSQQGTVAGATFGHCN
jgi:hypothetical protein